MGGLRALGRLAGWALLIAMVGVGAGLGAATVLDRGPRGEVRLSAFPLAVVLLDPSTWQAARDSLAAASLATVGSVFLGVGLGLILVRRRFWGRGILGTLALAPLAFGPLVVAPGLMLWVGGDGGWDWLAARSIGGASCEGLARLTLLSWVELVAGVPLVILATTEAARRVEPGWRDAARAVGASNRRIWRDLTWPILRPDVARAAAAVFVLALLEPAGPSILGLRRTLAVQVLDAGRRLDQPTRAAALASLAALIALTGWALIRRWGGPAVDRAEPGPTDPPPRASRGAGLASAGVLSAWVAASLGPALAVLWAALEPARGRGPKGWAELARSGLEDPEVATWAAHSAASGALAVGFALLVLLALAGGRPGGIGRTVAAGFGVVPPMALGVAALATPWLLGCLLDRAGPAWAGALRPAAAELAPARGPGWLLSLALAAGILPMLLRAADLAGRRARPVLVDAALALGVPPRKAGDDRWLGLVPPRAAWLAFALASTALAPALLLAPTGERRTLAVAAFASVLDSPPGTIDAHGVGPVLALVAIRGLALALAAGGRGDRLGLWFRP